MHFGPDTFIMRMVGASMEPRFRDGDYLYVDPDEPARRGRFVAIRDPDTREEIARLLVVEEGRRVLRTLRGDPPEVVLDADNETMILGTVVFGGRNV